VGSRVAVGKLLGLACMKTLLALLAFVVVLVGCDSTSEPDDSALVGTFTLQTVNGQNLPVFLGFFDGIGVTVLAGRLTLNADRTAAEAYDYRLTQGTTPSEASDSDVGVYTRNGNEILVEWSSGQPSETYILDDDTLTLDEDGFVFFYRK
jgi:hypothetical protein